MDERAYPVSWAEVEMWGRRAGVTSEEARKRFVQFVVLESVGGSGGLRGMLVFKGGNALRFVYGNRRTTVDLDFTALAGFPRGEGEIRGMLDGAWEAGGRKYGVKLRCQRVAQNPPGEGRTRPTWEITVGYQLPGDRHFAGFEGWKKPLSQTVRVEISINDVVCEAVARRLGEEAGVTIQVCGLEDILAEKLRALLQQRVRGRHRQQDPWDIASMVRRHGGELRRDKIGAYLVEKCRARGIEVRKGAFDEDIKRRAAFEYETLFSGGKADFVPFEEAWAGVLKLVGELPIPG